MTEADKTSAIGRRDALGLIAATVVADVALSFPARAAALSAQAGAGATAASSRAVSDLAKLTAEHFEPLVGQTFVVGANSLTLQKVRRGRNSGAEFRQQFGIVFHAPQPLPFHSQTMQVSHPALGRHDLLATQIGNGFDPGKVEICFA
jgi:hypothetical protein